MCLIIVSFKQEVTWPSCIDNIGGNDHTTIVSFADFKSEGEKGSKKKKKEITLQCENTLSISSGLSK